MKERKNTGKEAGLNKGGGVSNTGLAISVWEESGKRVRDIEGVSMSESLVYDTTSATELFGSRMLVRRLMNRRGGNPVNHGIKLSISTGNKMINDSRDLKVIGMKSGHDMQLGGDLEGLRDMHGKGKLAQQDKDNKGKRRNNVSMRQDSGLSP